MWDIIIILALAALYQDPQSAFTIYINNVIAIVVYYNPQSILVSFPLYTEILHTIDFWLELLSAHWMKMFLFI